MWASTGTRIPLCALYENLDSGTISVDEFVEWFLYGDFKHAVREHQAEALRAAPFL